MSTTTANMGLTKWTALNDHFNHSQLSDNFQAIDDHDHTTGKGLPVPSGGIASLAITTDKIADGAVTNAKLDISAIGTTKIADSSITTAKLATQAVTADKISILPSVRVYSGVAVSIPNATATPVTFTATRFESPSTCWDVSDPTKLIAPQAGLYLITGTVHWASSASGNYRSLAIQHNGSAYVAGNARTPTTASVRYLSVTALWHMATNDYVQLVAQQDAGSAQNLEVVSSASPEFAMTFVSL